MTQHFGPSLAKCLKPPPYRRVSLLLVCLERGFRGVRPSWPQTVAVTAFDVLSVALKLLRLPQWLGVQFLDGFFSAPLRRRLLMLSLFSPAVLLSFSLRDFWSGDVSLRTSAQRSGKQGFRAVPFNPLQALGFWKCFA